MDHDTRLAVVVGVENGRTRPVRPWDAPVGAVIGDGWAPSCGRPRPFCGARRTARTRPTVDNPHQPRPGVQDQAPSDVALSGFCSVFGRFDDSVNRVDPNWRLVRK